MGGCGIGDKTEMGQGKVVVLGVEEGREGEEGRGGYGAEHALPVSSEVLWSLSLPRLLFLSSTFL